MRILNRLGGIELADAYSCIKAISKKKLEMIAKFREAFIDGSARKGPRQRTRPRICSAMIEKFAGYGFNKSHSTAYALIAYQTAYLKAHYPVEFMAALLSGDIPGRNFKSKDPLVEHLEDCRRMDIEVVPPDVNCSRGRFRGRGWQNLFRPDRHQRLRQQAAEAIVAGRKAGRAVPACSISANGSIRRRATGRRSKRWSKQAPSIRSAPNDRNSWPRSIGQCKSARRCWPIDAAANADLFDCDDDDDLGRPRRSRCPTCPSLAEKEMLAMEKEVLGFYLSSHPLAPARSRRCARIARTTRSKLGNWSTHRSAPGRNVGGDQVFAHQEPATWQHAH